MRVGSVIAGRYQILKEIGSGGTSVVYLTADSHLRKHFAVKEIRKDDYLNADAMAGNLLREAEIMNRLHHRLLPGIIDVLDTPQYVYVVMDYIEGVPLDQYIRRRGRIDVRHAVFWFKQLCEVLTYLHMSSPPIIFRDLKPSNIMLTPDGSIRLIDFGAAREYKARQKTQAPNYGTWGYAAPEQVMGGHTDARSDIYSLGVTMHYLLTGVDPSDPLNGLQPIRVYDPSLPAALEQIILRCTQPDPNGRYPNCRELYYDLVRMEKGIFGAPPAAPRGRLSPIAIVSIVLSALIMIASLLTYFLYWSGG